MKAMGVGIMACLSGYALGSIACDAVPQARFIPDVEESTELPVDEHGVKKCPDFFQIKNMTGDSRIVHSTASDGSGTDSESQPHNTSWFWTKTEEDCSNSTGNNGHQYVCKGTSIPSRVVACQQGSCATLLECRASGFDQLP